MLKSNCQQISQRGGKKMRIVKFNNLSFTYYHLFVNLSKQIPFGGGIFMKKVFIPNDNTKEEIGKLPPEVLVAYHIVEPARKFGIACDCGNGLGEDGTGLVPFWHNGVLKYKCYKCGKVFDNFDLIAHHFNLDVKRDFPKVLAEGATLLGGMADIPTSSVHVSVKKKAEEIPQDFSAFIEEAL